MNNIYFRLWHSKHSFQQESTTGIRPAKTEPKNGPALCENANMLSLQPRSVHKMMIDDLSNGASLMKM